MTIYSNSFTPTWLMIKRHKITGLSYFCKTSRGNPEKYFGSGIYWTRHLKKYGKYIETVWIELFTDQNSLIEFAIFFSEFNDIIFAKDNDGNKIWANLEIENGIDGMPIGTDRGIIFKEKSKLNNTGNKNPSYGKYWWTDGINEIKSENCPLGWAKGRSPILKKQISISILKTDIRSGEKNSSYGKKWWTNGIDTIKSKVCPDGWYNGTGSTHRKKCKNKKFSK